MTHRTYPTMEQRTNRVWKDWEMAILRDCVNRGMATIEIYDAIPTRSAKAVSWQITTYRKKLREQNNTEKERYIRCLGGDGRHYFYSSHKGERVCQNCKNTKEWKAA